MGRRRHLGKRSTWLRRAALLIFLLTLGTRRASAESFGDENAQKVNTPEAAVPRSEAPPTPSTPPWKGDLWTRSQLSGDWLGERDHLALNGLTFLGDTWLDFVRFGGGGRKRQINQAGQLAPPLHPLQLNQRRFQPPNGINQLPMGDFHIVQGLVLAHGL